MPARSEHEDAFVLRSVDYGESDRILTLLTSRHGKVGVLARGARKSRRRFAGALEPFTLLDVELSFGRGEFARVLSSRAVRPFPGILRSLEAMHAAGAGMLLLRELLPEHAPDPAAFASTTELLEELDRGQAQPAALLHVFELHVFALAGFAPRLESCGVCGKRPAQQQAACFDPVRGFLVCRECGGAALTLSGPTRERLRSALREAWSSAAQPAWTKRELSEAEAALSAFARHRLERALPRPIAAGGLEGPKSPDRGGV